MAQTMQIQIISIARILMTFIFIVIITWHKHLWEPDLYVFCAEKLSYLKIIFKSVATDRKSGKLFNSLGIVI